MNTLQSNQWKKLTAISFLLFILISALVFSGSSWAEATPDTSKVKESFSLSLLGTPKYPKDFKHFDYANPKAPKGGKITLPAIGTYDNFNVYALRGNPLSGYERLNDTLFTSSEDEISSIYPLIGLSVRYSDSYQWAEVSINPDARFNDGTAITAEDVAFTFEKFMTEGVPQFRSIYKGVKVQAVSRLVVRFELPKPDRDQMLGLIGGLPVLPKHFWQHHSLGEPLSTPPLSSGPYTISDYKLGQYIVYQRAENYWAANLPVNQGRYNLNTIRYDYYLDDNVALEAFKAGAYDLRVESSPKNWTTQYQGKFFDLGYIVKKDLENHSAQDTRWLAFNVKRPIFADPKVRQALILAFDFHWMNNALFYSANQQPRSFFQNTTYEATGLPDKDELDWLMPLKDKVPEEVFTQTYQPPITDGSGNNRRNLLQAVKLLQQAGWEIKNNQLVNSKTGQPFTFELLLLSGSDALYVLPFQQSLAKLGIKMNVRTVDSSQYVSRLRSRDFDMIPRRYPGMEYPSTSLLIYWNTAYLDSTYNTPALSDPAVDELTQKISDHQGQEKPLLSLGRALDRVLTWHYLMIPMWYTNHDRFAYWNKYAMPAIRPKSSLGLDTWWYDADKAAQLPEQRR
ncbi:extracellular solute-binding protein [Pragia fontium]|uniref:extracellular solute-binding protein n=1 Tax=Pragia fontium TaxID=82985 RepID=UPI000F6D5286|nr:extracellular solute-binding protein [Pragia fontium]VEJ55938.1 Oligopeptide-binding protein AppA precursor [Pragia fontium]